MMMEPSISLKSLVILLGAAHGLFLALALINIRSGNPTPHRILACLTLTFATDLGVEFLRQSQYLAYLPKLFYIELLTSFVYGPLVYFYVDSLTSRQGFRFSPIKWLHFLPLILGCVLLIPFYTLTDSQTLELIYADPDLDKLLGLRVLGGVVVQYLPTFQIGVYVFLSLRQLLRHDHAIHDLFSSTERISLQWLRNLLIALCIIYLISVFSVFFSASLGWEEQLDDLFYFVVVIVIYSMGYMGLRQPVIFSKEKKQPALPLDKPDSSLDVHPGDGENKYQKSALNDETSKLLLKELERHMDEVKPYLDGNLGLAGLAGQLGLSSNYLSQVINEQTGSNFFDFINKYRVEQVKRWLADSSRANANILDIAMEAGFSSKSSFYTAFKKHANVTPSQYRKSLVRPAPE